MGILGYCYYFGVGTGKSLEEARRWWQMGIKTAKDDDFSISKTAYEKFFNDDKKMAVEAKVKEDNYDEEERRYERLMGSDDWWEENYGTGRSEDYFDRGERVYTEDNFDDNDDEYDCNSSMDMGYMEDDDYDE